MATKSYDYMHPTYRVHQQHYQRKAAGTGTTESFFTGVPITIVGWHLRVDVAGTATANTLALQYGTTAITTATLGTNTAGYTTSVDVTNTDVSALTQINLAGVGDATAVIDSTIEYIITPLGSVTA